MQVAIGNKTELTRQLSADEWALLYTECKRQALLGVGYVGIIDLPKEQTPPIGLLAQWIHDVEKIRKRNDLFNCCCEIVYKELQHDGLWSCILKGQANLIL